MTDLQQQVQADFESNESSVSKLLDIYVTDINKLLTQYRVPNNMPQEVRGEFDVLMEKLQLAKKLVFKDPKLTPQPRKPSFNRLRSRNGINRNFK